MSFENLNLNNPLRNAIEELGYVQPTPIQEKAFPVIMSGRDLVGIAQTGTGKTFAYLLPILRNLKYSEQQHPRVVIIVPTRELVVQVTGEIEKLSKFMNVRFAGVHGGRNMEVDQKLVYQGLDVIVGTPARLYDLYMTGVLRFKSVRKLVIDEVDELLAQGFRYQLVNLFELMDERMQIMMFSATLSEEVADIIDNFLINPEKIIIEGQGTPPDKIEQFKYHIPNYHTKINMLEALLRNHQEELSKVLVFVDNKKLADRIFEDLSSKFEGEMAVVHSNKAQNTRLNAVKRFNEGVIRTLISTDIASRGVDFKEVSHVINFDVPREPGDYIHRIGRTGRADNSGVAFTFVNQNELEYMTAIEELMGNKVEERDIPSNVTISNIYADDEKPNLFDTDYLPKASIKGSKGAYHSKLAKNTKVNLGGPGKKWAREKRKLKRQGKL